MAKTKKKKMAGKAKNLIVDKTAAKANKGKKDKRDKKQDGGQGQGQEELDERQEELMASMLDQGEDVDQIDQHHSDGGSDVNEEDEGKHGNFLKDIAAIEGAPR